MPFWHATFHFWAIWLNYLITILVNYPFSTVGSKYWWSKTFTVTWQVWQRQTLYQILHRKWLCLILARILPNQWISTFDLLLPKFGNGKGFDKTMETLLQWECSSASFFRVDIRLMAIVHDFSLSELSQQYAIAYFLKFELNNTWIHIFWTWLCYTSHCLHYG